MPRPAGEAGSTDRSAQHIESLLVRWAKHHYGVGAAVDSVAPMPGNAGISFGFEVVLPDGGNAKRESLVIRMPPVGVRRQGNTDVLRQVPLLQALLRADVPVPAVRWWGDDEEWFGVPYLVVERLPGRSLNIFAPDGVFFDLTITSVRSLFRQAIEALVAVHRVDWRCMLPDWEKPNSIKDEIRRSEPILAKGDDEHWIAQGTELRDVLLATCPAEPDPGLIHGDFYSNNWVVDAVGRLRAVVDWEISAIGPSLLDLGWLCMMYDPESWGPSQRARMAWAPAVPEIIAMYEEAAGHPVERMNWYRALAGYRLAAITSLNVRLQRSGKRPPDPVWDILAESFPFRVARAERLAMSGGGD